MCYNRTKLKRLYLILTLILFSNLVALSVATAQSPIPTPTPIPNFDPPRNVPIVAAWIQRTRGVPGPLPVIIAPRINGYHEVSPHSFTIEADGSLTTNNPVSDTVLVDYARANNIDYIPSVSSGWDNGPRLLKILNDPKLRADHVNAIIKAARTWNVDGIDLDYENLPPESQKGYTAFVTELGTALHNEGRLLSVTVPPKVRADDPCSFCKFTDYAAVGAVADRVRVMAYEYHGKSGGPGPIAPVWWMRQVISYTVSVVPSQKVQLGIHLYAYDWGGAETPAMWWTEVQNLKRDYYGTVSYPETDPRGVVGEAVLQYSIPRYSNCRIMIDYIDCPPTKYEKHTVWFVDARYVAESMKIIQDYNLGGIVLWRPGGEDPQIWNILAPNQSPRFDNQSGF